MFTIGITGPTGAGKTTALRVLEALGGRVYDCDEVYHTLLKTDRALLARIEAVLRRSRQSLENEGKLAAGNLRVNFREYTGTRGKEELAFTRKEIEILEYLWNNRDHAVPRAELLRKVWGYENAESVDTRTVDIHITKLRKKIEDDPAHPKLLVTFRGEGYQMRSAPECAKST